MLMNYFISLFTFIGTILAIKPFHGCDYFQNVEVGKSYDIFSPLYNRNGVQHQFQLENMDCRWAAEAPPGHILLLEFDDVYMPLSNNCKEGRIEVSANGKSDLSDANRFCGSRSFRTRSKDNQIVVALRAFNTSSGFFKCRLTASAVVYSQCECGTRNKNRIVGGIAARINEFPKTSGLVAQNMRTVFCGSTIISNVGFAITAAHCVTKRDINYLGLLVGDHDYLLGNDTRYAALYRLAKAIIHPEYSPLDDKNDIALVQTSSPIQFNEAVGAVCLPFRQLLQSEKFVNKIVEATGWGATEFSGPLSSTLQKVTLNVISNEQCSQFYSEGINSGQLCTYTVNKDTCQSDSGDPLLYTEPSNNLLYLVGVVSYGRGCATTSPGVNTRLTSYLDWIQRSTNTVQYCLK